MSTRTNPLLIGGFLVGAVGIVVLALLLWGSDIAFRARPEIVMYFDNSVKGLAIGAPVAFRGVSVGKVTEIGLIANLEQDSFLIPVVAEITRKTYTSLGNDYSEIEKRLGPLIDRGLRASLELQSLLTGQLYVNLDMLPQKPARFRGDGSLPEIPTIENPIQELGKSLEDFDIDELLANLGSIMDAGQRLLNDPALPEMVQHLNKSTKKLESVLTKLDRDFDPISEDTAALIKDTRQMVSKAQVTLENAEQLVSQESSVVYNINTALEEIADAARSVKALAEALERNPEAIIKGKK